MKPPDEKSPGRDGRSRSRALAASDTKILDRLRLSHGKGPCIRFSDDSSCWAAVLNDSISSIEESRRYCCCHRCGRLSLVPPGGNPDHPITLTNVTGVITGCMDGLGDPATRIKIIAIRDGDPETVVKLHMSGPALLGMEWISRLGPDAWYHRGLLGHVLEGWLATSIVAMHQREEEEQQ